MNELVSDEELAQWAEHRADDAGRLARELVQNRALRQEWQPANTAPKDQTWLLLRGRNSVGQPMVPVVAAWMPPGAKHQGWVDSGTFKPLDNLVTTDGADWQPLPL